MRGRRWRGRPGGAGTTGGRGREGLDAVGHFKQSKAGRLRQASEADGALQ